MTVDLDGERENRAASQIPFLSRSSRIVHPDSTILVRLGPSAARSLHRRPLVIKPGSRPVVLSVRHAASAAGRGW